MTRAWAGSRVNMACYAEARSSARKAHLRCPESAEASQSALQTQPGTGVNFWASVLGSTESTEHGESTGEQGEKDEMGRGRREAEGEEEEGSRGGRREEGRGRHPSSRFCPWRARDKAPTQFLEIRQEYRHPGDTFQER